MQVLLEYESKVQLDVDYEEIAGKVIETALLEYAFPDAAEVSLVLVDNERIAEVNREFRGIDRATDVLSFPNISFSAPGVFLDTYVNTDCYDRDSELVLLGDIMISVEKVIEQANAYGHSEQREFAFLVAHSMLHLFGYDHENELEQEDMQRRQEEILNICGYTRN